MLAPADLPPDDILDYVVVDTDKTGQIRVRVVEGKKHLRAVQDYLTRLCSRYTGKVSPFEFTTLDVIARLRQETVISGGENGINPVQQKMLGYPLILLTLCVVNMYNVHTRVIPMISAFAPEERWSVQMVILAKSSGLVIGYGLWLLAGLLLLAILIRMSFSLYKGPRRRYLDRIPPWSLYQTFHGVNYLFNISSMLQINIPLSHALTRIEKHAEHNRWLKSRISAIRKNVLSGQSLALAMKNSGYDFPSKSCVNNLLLNSEREDSVASMALYADRWLEEAKKNVRKSGIIITAISGLLVFLFIINMVSAIYGISDMLKQ
ncbi:type II secretion system F family protein [Escherichia coli]